MVKLSQAKLTLDLTAARTPHASCPSQTNSIQPYFAGLHGAEQQSVQGQIYLL